MIVTFSELAGIRSQHIDKKIILSSGAFDLFHVNHLHYLEEARKYGELLVVVISNNTTIRLSKGDSRPIYPELDRAEIINGLKVVDYVLIEPAGDGQADVSKVHADIFLTLKPDIFVTANDNWQSLKRVTGSVELVTLPRISGGRHSSTSAIVEHIRSSDFV
jgi:D-beta-D-heptose 7-phosphate kinase / D-beta-D-heptose 1-phosphate adenosyltransferase